MLEKKRLDINVVDGTDGVITLSDYLELVVISNTESLSADWNAGSSGAASLGMSIEFLYLANVTLNGFDVKILGNTIPEELADKNFTATAYYSGSSWSVFVNPNLIENNGIPYLAIDLTDSVVAADINSSAAIPYSKLNLTNGLLNADINSSAAIGHSKMAALTASRVAVVGAGGVIEAGTPTLTEVGYLSGVSSAIQTQLNSKLETIVNANVSAGAAVEFSKMEALTASRVAVVNAGGEIEAGTPTLTEVGYLSGVTSNIQTQLSAKSTSSLAQGAVFLGSGVGEAAPISMALNGGLLIGNGTSATAQTVSGAIALTNAGVSSLNSGVVTPSTASSNMDRDVVPITVSFETGLTNMERKIRLPYKCQLIYIEASVELTIAGTDDGTINFKDHNSNNIAGSGLSSGDLTITASSATGAVFASNATSNNTFAAGERIIMETRKTTKGGTAVVSLTFQRLDA